MSSQERLEVSIIENVQRSDLDPLEEAAAYKRLAEEFGLSQEEISGRVGKNRSTLANSMRLLKLPPEMQEALKSQKLSAGHARAILSLSQAAGQNALFKEIMDKSLSVREAEKRAEQLKGQAPAGKVTFKMQKHTIRNSELGALEQKFIEALGTKVVLDGSINSGTIKIDYFSMDDLDRIYEIVSGASYGE
jgi:ParB family chromosome partitioning protein